MARLCVHEQIYFFSVLNLQKSKFNTEKNRKRENISVFRFNPEKWNIVFFDR